jgi:hypothetical protein
VNKTSQSRYHNQLSLYRIRYLTISDPAKYGNHNQINVKALMIESLSKDKDYYYYFLKQLEVSRQQTKKDNDGPPKTILIINTYSPWFTQLLHPLIQALEAGYEISIY